MISKLNVEGSGTEFIEPSMIKFAAEKLMLLPLMTDPASIERSEPAEILISGASTATLLRKKSWVALRISAESEVMLVPEKTRSPTHEIEG
jgi:hypothetical protein